MSEHVCHSLIGLRSILPLAFRGVRFLQYYFSPRYDLQLQYKVDRVLKTLITLSAGKCTVGNLLLGVVQAVL